MKFVGIIFISFLFGTTYHVLSLPSEKVELDNKVPYDTVDTINDTVEGVLRPLIPETFELDGPFSLSFEEDLLNGTLNIAKLNVLELKTFLIPYMSASGLITIKLMIVFQELEVDADYDADIVILSILPIFGNGTAKIYLENLQITASADISVLSSPIEVQNTKIEIEVANLNLIINGLLNDDSFSETASGLLTTLANALIVPYINDNVEAISEIISPPIQDLLNQIISDLLGSGDDSGGDTDAQKAAVKKAMSTFVEELKQKAA